MVASHDAHAVARWTQITLMELWQSVNSQLDLSTEHSQSLQGHLLLGRSQPGHAGQSNSESNWTNHEWVSLITDDPDCC